jgi:hypothetical protein
MRPPAGNRMLAAVEQQPFPRLSVVGVSSGTG